MSSQPHASHARAEVTPYLADDAVQAAARARATELGCAAVEPQTGATLRFLAATLRARAVVEVGTGVGVSGLYLLGGMAADGVLTSIDVEPEHHRAARRGFVDAGYPQGRVRLIMGAGLAVLPRLTTGNYDLVFVDAAHPEYPEYHEHGVQLLRPGGIIAFHHVSNGHGADESAADGRALRSVARAVRADERLVPAVLPVGSGLLVAALAG